MAEQRLHQTTEQVLSQTLSPQQVRYVKMLEMNDAQLEEEVQRALDENPALEVVSPAEDLSQDFPETSDQMQLADYSSEEEVPFGAVARKSSALFDASATDSATLQEVLTEQLNTSDLSPSDRKIGLYIIGNIDDNGYLTRTPAEIADDIAMATSAEVTLDDVKRVWNVIRQFDPAGIAAIDLRDCLLLQLNRRNDKDPVVARATEIVRHYFDLFSKKHYEKILSATGMARKDLSEAVALIRELNPKPGSVATPASEEARMRHISPDFIVEPDESGNLQLTAVSTVPELAIEQTFAADSPVARKSGRDEAAASFLRRQRDDAASFIRLLSMRGQTLYRVMSAILKIQRQFFLTGNEASIRPMVLRDISALTGDDLSVVSRAASGKYVATPWGTFPLKHFFNEKFSSDAPDMSSREIIERIRAIIEEENPRKPLSDQAITDALSDAGFNVARRTVTKYREQLGLPVARLRKNI